MKNGDYYLITRASAQITFYNALVSALSRVSIFIYIYNINIIFHFRYCWHLIPLQIVLIIQNLNNGYFVSIFELLYEANCYL